MKISPFSTMTTTAGWIRPNLNHAGRNVHLLPEIHARAKRMLVQASKEMINANSSVVLNRTCEIWKAKLSGPTCTCTLKSDEATKERSKDSYLDLKSFLITKEISPAKVKESCHICYGTGFVGGYDLQGASTTVLDCSSEPSLKEATLVRERPWWVKASSKSKVSWLTVIPKYIVDVYGVLIKWKEEPNKYRLFIEDELLTRESLLNYAGKRVSITLEMKDSSKKEAGVYAIFLVFATGSTQVNVDIPNFTRSFSGTLRVWSEIQESITANFDSRVNNLTPMDIFVIQEGFIYRIVEVESNKPLDVVISWNCQCNLVRQQAWYYHIHSKLVLNQYTLPNTTFIV
jgi:hypothetical protein